MLQIQQDRRFAPYRFPLLVEVRDAGGAAHRTPVQVAARRTQRIPLPLELDRPPQQVTFDADVQLLASFVVR